MASTARLALCAALLLGVASAPASARGAVDLPYGTAAQQQACVGRMEASLRGRSILGSRDTAAYIQDRGELDSLGITEYDVMVGRCMDTIYHGYLRRHGLPVHSG